MNQSARFTGLRRLATIPVLLWACLLGLLAGPALAQLNCNAGVEFHPDGGIKRCQLNGRHQFYTNIGARLVCRDGADAWQYPDGRIRRCTLGETYRSGDARCEAPAVIELSSDGHLLRCEPG
jgi:hypothetical protein